MSLFEKLKNWVSTKKDAVVESVDVRDDWETRDKSLMALRRLRRRQLDEMERKQLVKDMSEYNQAKSKAYLNDSSIFNSGGNLKSKKKFKGRLFGDECGFMSKNNRRGLL
jgi:hypothetical protein